MEKTTMNIKEMVRATAAKVGKTQKEVQAVLDGMDSVVRNMLTIADKDTIVEVKVLPCGLSVVADHVAAHEARNPKTGETVTVNAKNRVRAKLYKGIKAAANE